MATLTARDIISNLVQHLGMTDVTLGADGSCGLLFDQETNVTLEPDVERPGILHLHTVVGTVPAENRKALFVHLLRGNYLGRATSSAVLALDAEETSVLMQTSLCIEHTDLETLSEQLAGLVQAAKLWGQRLAAPAVNHFTRETSFDPLMSSMLRV